MNRIERRFTDLARKGEPAFVAYLTAGDPSLDATAEFILELERAGVDVIECGVPFSDPVADGVVIQAAAQRALERGATLLKILEMIRGLRAKTEVPILLFTYFNPVYAYGIERFARDAQAAGVDGVLTVDLPPEEADEYKRCLDEQHLATVFLVAPNTPPDRIERIARLSTGFVYYVSRTGVTGVRSDIEASVHDMVSEIRRHTNKPIAVGFGISTPEQAAEVGGYANGVVVGSALVRLIGEVGDSPDAAAQLGDFARSLVAAAKQAGPKAAE